MTMNATVLRVDPNGLLVRDASTGNQVFVNFRNTGAFRVGDAVRITFNGVMTRSIPPQITATAIQRVSPAPPPRPTPPPPPVRPTTMNATVLRVEPNGLLVRDASTGNQVFVNFRNTGGFRPGDTVRIAYNGVMTRSIPPQITATSIQRVSPAPPPRPTPPPPPFLSFNAVVLRVEPNRLIVRDTARNIQTTVNYPFARHFCPGQRVSVRYRAAFGNTVTATDVIPECRAT